MTWQPALAPVAEAIFLVLVGVLFARLLYYLLLLALAFAAFPQAPPLGRSRALWRRYANRAPSVAIIAPAYNEELSVVASVMSLLEQIYPEFEVIIVNDGSTDGTLRRLIDNFGLRPVERDYNLWVEHAPIKGLYGTLREPRLLVVDKAHGGCKADAVNAGINVARKSLVCVIDADSLLERDALARMARPFIRDPQRMIAVGGSIRVVNGCKVERGDVTDVRLPRSLLARVQILEYLRAFLLARVAMSRIGTLTIISGALGLFDRRVLLEVGGFGIDTCGEDLELIVRMHRHMREQGVPYRVAFVPDPVCWTEVPETLAGLASQRARWQRGSIETFLKHRKMAFNPTYGRIGTLAFGRIFAVDFISPFLASLGYLIVPLFWALGVLSVEHFLAFLAVDLSFGIFISLSTLALEELELRRSKRARDLAVLALIAIAENLGYRQLSNFWRLRGFYDHWRGNTDWVAIKRQGFGQPPPPAGA